MSTTNDNRLSEVRVHGRPRRDTQIAVVYEPKKTGNSRLSSRNNTEYVYVNSAYAGSLSSVNASENRLAETPPPTSVIREQYWACSKWPYGQRILAIAVGVLVGAVVGMAVTIGVLGMDKDDVVGGIFRSATPD